MSEIKEKEYMTLDEILHSDSSFEIYIESLERWVKIKNASTNDRIEAEKMAMLHPSWSIMSKDDKDLEVGKMLSLSLLVEPAISYNDYTKSDDIKMQILLNCVANEYSIKVAKLTEQQGHNVRRFLEAILGKDLMSILSSLNSKDLISTEPVESGDQ